MIIILLAVKSGTGTTTIKAHLQQYFLENKIPCRALSYRIEDFINIDKLRDEIEEYSQDDNYITLLDLPCNYTSINLYVDFLDYIAFIIEGTTYHAHSLHDCIQFFNDLGVFQDKMSVIGNKLSWPLKWYQSGKDESKVQRYLIEAMSKSSKLPLLGCVKQSKIDTNIAIKKDIYKDIVQIGQQLLTELKNKLQRNK